MKLIKNFLKENRKYFVRTAVFFILIAFLFLLSNFLTKITFLEGIDINDPDHIFKKVPEVDIQQREMGMILLLIFFGFISIFVGKWQGFASLFGIFLSVFTIYKLIIPLILGGWSPPIVTFIAGSIVISGTVFFAHGFNPKTIIAVVSSTATLIIILFIGELFRQLLQITGYSSQETYYLLANSQIDFDMARIVLASIVLSGIGLLDDISVTQASIIHELDLSKPTMKLRELYASAMNVGRDHAGAVVNSLFWVYTASTLPLLLLASFDGVKIAAFLNNNVFMEEVLRTLVTSSGLILAIPITTLLGALAYKNPKFKKFLLKFIDNATPGHLH